jgi:hypothetical protein
MDETYSPASIADEALYAELDGESIKSDNSSMQNNQYSQSVEVNQDVSIVLSAPSSAYYSDLSNAAASSTERAYEIVDLTTITQPPLEEISESNGVISPTTTLVPQTATSSTSHIIDGKLD